jgi:hypothetical protein
VCGLFIARTASLRGYLYPTVPVARSAVRQLVVGDSRMIEQGGAQGHGSVMVIENGESRLGCQIIALSAVFAINGTLAPAPDRSRCPPLLVDLDVTSAPNRHEVGSAAPPD